MILKTNKRISLFSLIVVLMGVFVLPNTSEAAMTTQAGFEVTTIPPEQQTSKNLGSFSFNANAGESYKMGFKIKNDKNYPIKVKIIPTVAVTNSNGDIIYNKVTKKRDSSLKMDFTKLGPKKLTISLQPDEEKTVNGVTTKYYCYKKGSCITFLNIIYVKAHKMTLNPKKIFFLQDLL